MGDQLDSIVDDCICSICMELLLRPKLLLPCAHVFCDPCLRLLNKCHSNNIQVRCPKCRQYIHCCINNRKMLQRIQLLYPTELQAKLKQANLDGLFESTRQHHLPGFKVLIPVHLLSYGIGCMYPSFKRRTDKLWNSYLSPFVTINWIVILSLSALFFFVIFVPGVLLASTVIECFTNSTCLQGIARNPVLVTGPKKWIVFLANDWYLSIGLLMVMAAMTCFAAVM